MDNSNHWHIVTKAAALAVKLHAGQFRHGPEKHPYIVHPARVAELLMDDGLSPVVVAAGWLHDVIEDCEITPTELQYELGDTFGEKIVKLVLEVTNPSRHMNHMEVSRADRKRLDFEHIAKASVEAKLIKLADRIDNMRDTINYPPSQDRLGRMLRESNDLYGYFAYTNVGVPFEVELTSMLCKYKNTWEELSKCL